MGGLQLNLFGKLDVVLDGAPVTAFESAKVPALLAYLVMSGQAHSRDTLATLLWGDLPEATAKRNLSKALTNLRQLLEPYLLIERHSVAFNHQLPAEVDAVIFRAAVEGSALLEPDNPERDLAPLRQAISLYRGDFLEGFYVKNALEFEEWALGQREYLRGLALQALRLLTEQSGRLEANPAAALEYCRRWLELEPWQEAAHRHMMLLLARNGQRDAALAQYEACRQVLAEELDVAPAQETTLLYERLKAAGEPIPHNLPPPAAFVGRERELDRLHARLGQPDCRLLTLVGPGGVGKTRLAIEIARHYLAPTLEPTEVSFADGVYFVNLAPVGASEIATGGLSESSHVTNLILVTIASALDFSFEGAADLRTQMLAHLRRKEMLLVLDNFEHLVEGAGLLVELLNAAPGLRLLVTSRERLNLREEWVWDVGGLAYPGQGDSQLPLSDLQTYDAIVFFCLQAQRIRGDFSLSESEAPDLLRLCQLVDGAPLALELAASWLRVLSCAEVVAGVERSLDFLTSSLRNTPGRHRSMRAVFEQSWQMLSAPEQTVFGQLSVFEGGFQREAAQAVAGAGLPILVSLVDKSLLRVTPSGRYQLHELLRQFAAEQLAGQSEADTAGRQGVEERHSRYYLTLLSQHEAALYGGQSREAITALKQELDNIRQAWHWAAGQARLADLTQSLEALAVFYELLGLFREGEEVFRATAAGLEAAVPPANRAGQSLICRLRIEQARFVGYQGHYSQAKDIITAAEPLVAALGEALLLADLRLVLGLILIFLGDLDEAVDCLYKALADFRQLDRPRRTAAALSQLGEAYSRKQLQDEALPHLQQALQIDTELGDKRAQALTSMRLGNVHALKDMNNIAMTYYRQALAVFQKLGDTHGVAKSLANIGLTHYYLGQYAAVFEPSNQALDLCRKLGNIWGQANTLENLGIVYLALGEHASAQACLEEGLALARTGGSKLVESYITYRLAELYIARADYIQGQAYLEQAMKIGGEMGEPTLVARCLGQLGRIHQWRQANEAALACYNQAITDLLALSVRFEAIHVMIYKAGLLFELGRPEEGRPVAGEAARLAEEIGYPPIATAAERLLRNFGGAPVERKNG